MLKEEKGFKWREKETFYQERNQNNFLYMLITSYPGLFPIKNNWTFIALGYLPWFPGTLQMVHYIMGKVYPRGYFYIF